MDLEKIKSGVRLILEGVGENPERSGLRGTPEKTAEMFAEVLAGTGKDFDFGNGLEEQVGEDVIIIKNIAFYSMCEHHLLPFFGKVHLAFVPKNNRVVGFSTLVRLVENFAKRLQLQERLTNQIADALMENLKPIGLLVMIEARQLCVSMRGSKKDAVETVTQATRGKFPLESLRSGWNS